jgi:hypothetical protein
MMEAAGLCHEIRWACQLSPSKFREATAIDRESMTGDKAGLVGGEKQCRARDIDRHPYAAEHAEAFKGGFHRRIGLHDRPGHRGENDAGDEVIGGDTKRPELHWQHFSQSGDGVLGRRIRRESCLNLDRSNRGKVDDPPCSRRSEVGRSLAAELEHRCQVDIQMPLPVLIGRCRQRLIVIHARIIDENIKLPELRDRGVHDALGRIRGGHVGGYGFHLRISLVCNLKSMHTTRHRDDICAFLCKQFGDRLADTF